MPQLSRKTGEGMSQPTDLQIHNLITDFEESFRMNLRAVYNSGALSGDESPLTVARAVLLITAKDFGPRDKALLKNLECFV
jgi:hypothetical protein